jgi:glutamate synthase domain-containing protein 3
MELEDIIKLIGNVSKAEIKRVAPKDCSEIKKIILNSNPGDTYRKMVLGYLTSICAECMYPETLQIPKDDLDYIGFELEKGNIEVGSAGNMLGTCMRNGKITARKAGDDTGKSMTGGDIIADEIKSIGDTIGGKITTKKAGKIAKGKGAQIFINGVMFKRSLMDRLFGK